MTDWILFFKILIQHRQGFSMTLPYSAAVDHPGDVAQVLYMFPPPDGHPIGLTAQAKEWISEGEDS